MPFCVRRTRGYSMILKGEKSLAFLREGEFLQLEGYGPDVIRVRASLNPVTDEGWTLLAAEPYAAHIYEEDGLTWLKNGKIKVSLSSGGRLAFYKEDGSLLLQEKWMEERDQPGRILRGFPGGAARLEAHFLPQENEHFYGMGQEAHDLFDLKGAVIELCHQNTKSTIPFVISSRGYGFLWNNPAIGRAEFGTSMTRWVAEAAEQMDFLVFTGDSPAALSRIYAKLTGFAPELPYWATGLWQSKLRYETQEELLTVAREYKKRGIPLSLIVCDYFHWPQQGEWKFDTRYWPDPQAMVDELRAMDVKLLVSIWPTVDPRSENYPEMRDRNMLIRTERGPGPLVYCRGPETYYDTMNPEARQFVWSRVKENYYGYGIRNFWLDEAEPEIGPYDYDNLRYYKGNGLQVSELYPYYYAKTFYDGQRAAGQEEIVNLIRCAYPGTQKFGTVLWSGDIMSDFASLRRQIKTGLHVAVSGIPWWTTDIGGFHGGDPDDPKYREVYIRWFQFGAFCPILRMHGFRFRADRPKSNPYSMDSACPSGGPNEPWSFGEEAYEIMTHYIRVREKLRPYIYENLKKTAATGLPLMRPLFFDFSGEKLYGIFDQYMFGPDLMVCPVYEAGVKTREVYIPEGADFIEAATGRLCRGGATVTAEAPLARIPVFIRAGSPLTADMF